MNPFSRIGLTAGRSFALAALLAAMPLAGCNTAGGSGSRAGRTADDRGGSAPADTSIVGRRDGGTDRARAARATDQNRSAGAQGALRHTLAYPTGDRQTSVLMLEAEAPEQVRVGQPYNYTLRVTNLTDTPLHGVEVRDLSGQVPADRTGTHAGHGGEAAGPERQRPLANNDNPDAARDAESNRDAVAAGARTQAAAGAPAWTVGTLGPKQTQTRQFSATADEIGTISNCLSVTYNPTLCMAVNVVRPEIQIVKAAPSQVLICQDITNTYTVTNSGTPRLGVRKGP